MSDHIEHACPNCESLVCNGRSCYRKLEAERDKYAEAAKLLRAHLSDLVDIAQEIGEFTDVSDVEPYVALHLAEEIRRETAWLEPTPKENTWVIPWTKPARW